MKIETLQQGWPRALNAIKKYRLAGAVAGMVAINTSSFRALMKKENTGLYGFSAEQKIKIIAALDRISIEVKSMNFDAIDDI